MNIDRLSYANIDSRPVHYDWRACWDRGEEPTYTVYQAVARDGPEYVCRNCGEGIILDDNGAGEELWCHTFGSTVCGDDPPGSLETDEDSDTAEPEDDWEEKKYHVSWDGESGPEDGLEGPMMNYYYPLDVCSRFDPKDAAINLVGVPLCLVEFEDGDYALALTGGGMDLSWEICEAFIRLDQYPPTHFCDLPDYKNSDDDLSIIGACKMSLEAKMAQFGRTLDTLTSMEHKRS